MMIAPMPNSSDAFATDAVTSDSLFPNKRSTSITSTSGLPFLFTPAVVARTPRRKNEPMPVGFEPGCYDVICGLRGKQALQHVGNRRFRVTIAMNAEKYLKAPTKLDKSLVVISVVDAIRNGGGSFVRKDRKNGGWVDIGDQLAREKVGHALRDHINSASGDSKKKKKSDKERSAALREMLSAAKKACPPSPTISSKVLPPLISSPPPPPAPPVMDEFCFEPLPITPTFEVGLDVDLFNIFSM